MPKYDALFFDFDGVLTDSVDIKSEAFLALYLDATQVQKNEILDYHLKNGGMSRYKKIEYYNREIFDLDDSVEAIEALAQRFSQLVVEKVVSSEEIAGAGEFLEAVHSKTPLFIVSGTPENELTEIIRRRYSVDIFQEVLGSPTLKHEHLKYLLMKYGFTAENCLFFGDALGDKEASESCGIPFIAINPAKSLREVIENPYADWLDFMNDT